MLLGGGRACWAWGAEETQASPGAVSDLFLPGSQSSQADAFQGQFSFLRQALHTAHTSLHTPFPRPEVLCSVSEK